MYFDPEQGSKVTLIDTPGFGDSRDGVTDVDVFVVIAEFLNNMYGNLILFYKAVPNLPMPSGMDKS